MAKLNENTLKQIIRASVKRILREYDEDYRYMSDEDIANQYSDFNVLSFEIEPNRTGNGWSGYFELEFPNADNIDYDGWMCNNFFVYDKLGKQIAWDNWMPDEQTNALQDIIRKEIKKRLANQ